MIEETELDLVEGSGNVFRDMQDPDADLKQAKAVLAARIISALDSQGLSVRRASKATGFVAADFSRIRNAHLGRFTLDRLFRMHAALDRAAGVTVHVGGRSRSLQVRDTRGEYNAVENQSIIVDMSYFRAAKSLHDLQKDWILLFPDAFIHELVSADAQFRNASMRKLRELNRVGGVRIVPDLGELMRKEILELTLSGPPSENVIKGIDLGALFDEQFENSSKARREVLKATELRWFNDVDEMIAQANTLFGKIAGAQEGTTENRRQACQRARNTVAHDRDFIAQFFANMMRQKSPKPERALILKSLAQSREFGPAWAIFRRLQVQLLYGLELVERHGEINPKALPPGQRERLHNEVVDMEYVTLGAMQGALATNDNRMSKMFEILRPDGTIKQWAPESGKHMGRV